MIFCDGGVTTAQPAIQPESGGEKPTPSLHFLRASDYRIQNIELALARQLVKTFHYSGGGSNTATYKHGMFPLGWYRDSDCLGVAWWIPPTKTAAFATYPKNWKGVLSLTRLVLKPEAPRNSASFLIAHSMAWIDRKRWPCLVTYADTWRGHTGAIYRATNWEYMGLTKPERTYVLSGRLVARKAGPKTRTHQQMLDLGAACIGSFAKHKFRHIV